MRPVTHQFRNATTSISDEAVRLLGALEDVSDDGRAACSRDDEMACLDEVGLVHT